MATKKPAKRASKAAKKPAAKQQPATIDEYIASFPSNVRAVLRALRKVIGEEAPHAEEMISYRMPAFVSGKNRVYIGAFKRHIGMYPPVPDERQLERYLGPKGNLILPLDQPMPLPLIRKVVRFQLRAKRAQGGG